jgi:hypothetical protein
VRLIVGIVERRRSEGEITLSRKRARDIAARIEAGARRLTPLLREIEQGYSRCPALYPLACGEHGLLRADKPLHRLIEDARHWCDAIPATAGQFMLADVLGVPDARLLCATGVACLYGELRKRSPEDKRKLPGELNGTLLAVCDLLWLASGAEPSHTEDQFALWRYHIRKLRAREGQLAGALTARGEIDGAIRNAMAAERRRQAHRQIMQSIARK